ncbi:MAG: AAA family ATPase [candidate division WOR-3 bacterium]
MVSKITIKNFKSIKELSFNAKRINLFIGKPNTGKSNILEALGVFSLSYRANIKELIRLEKIADLFWNKETSLKIEVYASNFKWETYQQGGDIYIKADFIEKGSANLFDYRFDNNANFAGSVSHIFFTKDNPFKFYRFKTLPYFPYQEHSFLLPPNGENLLAILNTNQEIYNFVKLILDEFKLQLVLEEGEAKIKILKLEPKTILFPYLLLSDTLQRIIFHFVAIKSNRDSIILFEEPEAHSFPYYTKILAETIAFDKKNNQYFISTHNPYFLSSLIEKTPKEELTIFYVYIKEHQTMLKELSDKEKEDISTGKIDPFFQFSED